MTANYFLRLSRFEGPLDLLLHLIKVSELDIFDIDLLALTTQYLEHLRLIQYKDIKDAAAFLEMAAKLIEIKSYHLLPTEDENASDQLSDKDHDLSLQKLQLRLIEYDSFQKAAAHLTQLAHGGTLNLTNHEGHRLEALYEDECKEPEGDNGVLLILYEQLLSTLTERTPITISVSGELITISEAMERMKNYLDKISFFMLQKIFNNFESRYELIVNIMATLQLAREQKLSLYQEEDCGPIWLSDKNNHSELSDKISAMTSQEKQEHINQIQ